jgi:hypothetical protein
VSPKDDRSLRQRPMLRRFCVMPQIVASGGQGAQRGLGARDRCNGCLDDDRVDFGVDDATRQGHRIASDTNRHVPDETLEDTRPTTPREGDQCTSATDTVPIDNGSARERNRAVMRHQARTTTSCSSASSLGR